MEPRPMVVTFRRQARTCTWTALRPPRTRVPGTAMAAGGGLPHDLATFVIERHLGVEHGFWGCVAAGATFRSLGRRRTPQGKEVIARHAESLDEAERQVNAIYAGWRAGAATPAGPALDEMLQRWRDLGDGDDLELEWQTVPSRRRRRRTTR